MTSRTPHAAPDDSAPQESAVRLWRDFRWSASSMALASLAGVAATTLLKRRGYGFPDPGSMKIFYRLYTLHERPFFVLLAVFASVTCLYARHALVGQEKGFIAAPRMPRVRSAVAVLAAAVLVGAISWAGSHLVLHDLPFSMDEYNAIFQAKIFEAGRVTAQLPRQWQVFANALTPVFVAYYPDQHTWRSGYLPIYASIQALFDLAGATSLTNPVLGALTVITMAAAGRRLWPASPLRVALAVLFLVTSSQFLFMSMSWYSMPAHLLLNLAWLWLYLRDDVPSLAAAPIVGVLALGLHNPFPHALFVAPFLIRMVRRRRFAWLGYAAVVYGAGSLLWLWWLRSSDAYVGAAGGLLGMFKLPGVHELEIQALQLSLVISWQAPLVAVLALVALLRWRRLGETERDLAAGLLLTAAVYSLIPLNQGHGWGDRYIYGALGNLIIIAAAVCGDLMEGAGGVRVTRLVVASTLIALLIQWPLRAVQAERFVRPFARGIEYAQTRPEPVVIVYPDSSYYGRDMIRNDPFLRKYPVILSAQALGDSGVQQLMARFPGRVHQLWPAELARLGVPTF